MGQKLWGGAQLSPLFWGGAAGSPSSTMCPWPRPTSMPSFILIRPTVWPQYTNITDRQTDRQTDRTGQDRTGQWSNSTERTVSQTVAQKLKPGLVTSYYIQPGNGEGLFLYQRFILSLISDTHLQLPDPHGAMLDGACDGGSCGLAQWAVGLEQQWRQCMVFVLKAEV